MEFKTQFAIESNRLCMLFWQAKGSLSNFDIALITFCYKPEVDRDKEMLLLMMSCRRKIQDSRRPPSKRVVIASQPQESSTLSTIATPKTITIPQWRE
jgi:hypothetical protein